MNNLEAFEAFSNGFLRLPEGEKNFSEVPWSPHPTFDGVELKHIVTSKDTNGKFSFHLVKIAPNKCIKSHIHESQLESHEVISGSGISINGGMKINYEKGVISIFPTGISHEVAASGDGLFIFAKFFPALC